MNYETEAVVYRDRREAGRQLAGRLRQYEQRRDVLVLGIPRGGVPVAFEIAKALHAPLDVFISRKLGVPGQEELAFGGIASGGVRVLDQEIIESMGISRRQIEQITARVKQDLEMRERHYRGDRPQLSLEGQTVILVDDGIATGSSIRAAIQALKQLNPARIVVAVPVAPQSTCDRLRPEVDELICGSMPEHFFAIGQFYADFSQVSDEEVAGLLQRSAPPAPERGITAQSTDVKGSAMMNSDRSNDRNCRTSEVRIQLQDAVLEGILGLPEEANGIVLFAHGSGSSRHSPRNRYVSQVLQSRGIATLLFDLLTGEEESIDQFTGELRFNIPFLAHRLVDATRWVQHNPQTRDLKLGYFGASTGAAAALVAASELSDVVSAVVSRGGRPDLAAGALGFVTAATLLIVGGNDEPVIAMNREALSKLRAIEKKLLIIPAATHLFEEPGTLEEVARVAAAWFSVHLTPANKGLARPMAVSVS